MVIGIVIYTTGKEELKELGGVARKLPITTGAAVISFLSVAGIPFINGYLSKVIIKEALTDPLLIRGFYLIGTGTVLVFLKFMYSIFFIKNDNSEIKIFRKPTKYMLLSVIVFSLFMIVLGINPVIIENLFNLNINLNYFELNKVIGGFQPFIWGFLIFVVWRKYIIKEFSALINFDFYQNAAVLFKKTGKILSDYHTGNLSRYLLWALTALIFIWIKINYI